MPDPEYDISMEEIWEEERELAEEDYERNWKWMQIEEALWRRDYEW